MEGISSETERNIRKLAVESAMSNPDITKPVVRKYQRMTEYKRKAGKKQVVKSKPLKEKPQKKTVTGILKNTQYSNNQLAEGGSGVDDNVQPNKLSSTDWQIHNANVEAKNNPPDVAKPDTLKVYPSKQLDPSLYDGYDPLNYTIDGEKSNFPKAIRGESFIKETSSTKSSSTEKSREIVSANDNIREKSGEIDLTPGVALSERKSFNTKDIVKNFKKSTKRKGKKKQFVRKKNESSTEQYFGTKESGSAIEADSAATSDSLKNNDKKIQFTESTQGSVVYIKQVPAVRKDNRNKQSKLNDYKDMQFRMPGFGKSYASPKKKVFVIKKESEPLQLPKETAAKIRDIIKRMN